MVKHKKNRYNNKSEASSKPQHAHVDTVSHDENTCTNRAPVWLSTLLLSCGLIMLVFIVHWHALDAKRLYDDFIYYIDNPNIADPSRLFEHFAYIFVSRGWVQLSFAWDWKLYSDFMFGAHLSSIIYHTVAAFLLWCVAHQLFLIFPVQRSLSLQNKIQSKIQSKIMRYYRSGFLTALLFAIHPLSTQPIAHLSSRANIVVTLIYLLGFLIALLILRICIKNDLSLTKQRVLLVVQFFVVCFFSGFGLGAKELIVTLPVMVFIINLLALSKHKSPLLLSCNLIYIIGIISGVILFFIYRYTHLGFIFSLADSSARLLSTNLYTQAVVIVSYYIPRLFFPYPLYYHPHFPEYNSLTSAWVFASFLSIAVIVSLSVWLRSKTPLIPFGVFWFFITLAPTSSFIPLIDIVAERRMYLSLIGVMLILEWGVLYLLHHAHHDLKKVVLSVCMIVLVVFAGLSIMRNKEFTHVYTLVKKDIEQQYAAGEISPLSVGLLIQNMNESNQRDIMQFLVDKQFDFQRYIAYMREAKQYRYDSFQNIVRFLTFSGLDNELTHNFFQFLLEEDPNNIHIWSDYQNFLLQTQQYDKAKQAVQHALTIDANNVSTLLNLCNVHLLENNPQEALTIVNRLAEQYPENIKVIDYQLKLYPQLGLDTAPVKERMNRLHIKENMITNQWASPN